MRYTAGHCWFLVATLCVCATLVNADTYTTQHTLAQADGETGTLPQDEWDTGTLAQTNWDREVHTQPDAYYPDYPGFNVSWCGSSSWSEAAALAVSAALHRVGVRVGAVRRVTEHAGDGHGALAAEGGAALGCGVSARATATVSALSHEVHVRDLGDSVAPASLAVLALRPPPGEAARAHTDLRTALQDEHYRLTRTERYHISQAHRGSESGSEECLEFGSEAETCGTLVVLGAERDARDAALALRRAGVCVCVVHAGEGVLPPRALLVGVRGAERSAVSHEPHVTLATPPCAPCDLRAAAAPCQPSCPFEPTRYPTFASERALAFWPQAEDLLVNFWLSDEEAGSLAARTLAVGAPVAAAEFLNTHGERLMRARPRELRVGVLLPSRAAAHTFSAVALEAAVILADADRDGSSANESFRFKTDACAAGCSAPAAFKYVTDVLAHEYASVSALAGPACGAALRSVLGVANVTRLPVLAYTAAAAAPGGMLLAAAGSARSELAPLEALCRHYDWRRVALVTEPAAGRALSSADLDLNVVARLDLPDTDEWNFQLFEKWAEEVMVSGTRVVVAWVEDARAARAALCALWRRGARSQGGAWLLPAHLGAAAGTTWSARDHERLPCDAEELLAAASGVTRLGVMPEWAWRWERGVAAGWESGAQAGWAMRWQAECVLVGGHSAECARPPAGAALLYDALRLWADALAALLRDHPMALYDIHRLDHVRFLMNYVRSTRYNGTLTGTFEWEELEGVWSRSTVGVLMQWEGKGEEEEARVLARWERGALAWEGEARWERAPGDGRERCVVRALADALGADCRAAALTLTAGALAALAAATAGALWRARLHVRRALQERALAKLPPHDMTELRRECLIINRVIGEGAFGRVYGGHALLPGSDTWLEVAIKTLKEGASREDKLNFLSEAETMKRFSHPNVVRLLAVVTVRQPLCAVMEYMMYGDLKTYLLARRHLVAEGDPLGEVTAELLTRLALDAARGLAYLASKRYVHRDVAARNCLVSSRRKLKIGDFGMARVLYDSDYYQFLRRGRMPLRWMAPESVARGFFSPASDVWALGVLLYETVTMGALPHHGFSNEEVVARLRAGASPGVPRGVRPRLEGVLAACWRREAAQRPSAAEVAAQLADHPALLAPCLSVPLDPLPLHAPDNHHHHHQNGTWARAPSSGTGSTWLSAELAPSPPLTALEPGTGPGSGAGQGPGAGPGPVSLGVAPPPLAPPPDTEPLLASAAL